ncbi:MAG: IS1380 family transposase [Planctomycetota bacterium]
MELQGVWEETFDFFAQKPIVVEPIDDHLSTDAGLLPIRQLDEALGLTEQFAAALIDRRGGNALRHTYLEMTRSRVYGILAGYEDQNDHDALRSDAVFKLIAGRLPEDDPLASQPTLSRFENAIGPKSLFRLQDVLIDQFIASFDEPPRRLTFDIDTFDDPTHGQQQLTFFHGYYDQYQYQPRVITCAENDQVVMAALLFGTASPTLGVVDDLEHLVARLRAVWPDVRILIRADSGFAVPGFYEGCERLRLDYTVGLKINAVLKRQSDDLLAEAVARFEATGQPQRLFTAFWYQAGSWPAARWVVVKAEAHGQGTNRRVVMTNRRGAFVLPEAAYDEYAARGESENRNKELKCSLSADRLSDHRFMANYFRLYLHLLSANLLVRVRRLVADPPAPEPGSEVPTEALAGRDRKRWFNRRREHDPLGEGHAETWRMRLIKVAAQIVVSTRRVLVRLSGSWPFLSHYQTVSAAVNEACARLALDTS